jgi:hypothetical protein
MPYRRRPIRTPAALLILVAGVATAVAAGDQSVRGARSVLDLQPYRRADSIAVTSGAGREGTATLVNLHAGINAWHLLTVAWKDASEPRAYHLENPDPRARRVLLDPSHPSGVVLVDASGRTTCDLFGGPAPGALESARLSRQIYPPLCNGRLYLRNPATGHRTGLEAATEFFRERGRGPNGSAAVRHGHERLIARSMTSCN